MNKFMCRIEELDETVILPRVALTIEEVVYLTRETNLQPVLLPEEKNKFVSAIIALGEYME